MSCGFVYLKWLYYTHMLNAIDEVGMSEMAVSCVIVGLVYHHVVGCVGMKRSIEQIQIVQ